MKTPPIPLVALVFALAVSASALRADDIPLISFEQADVADVVNEPVSKARLSIDDGALLMQADHFWENVFKVQKNIGDTTEVTPAQFLKLEAMLDTKDQNPVLKLLVFSKDWKKKALWEFDLSGAKQGAFVTLTATTPVDQPMEGSDADFNISQGIGGIQFATAAKGVNPWSLRIKSLAVGAE